MKVLVTGHDGYIGSVLMPMARQAGHEVEGLDCFLFEGCGLEQEHSPVAAVRTDIRDVTVEDVAGYDAVIHLAAISNDPLGDLAPDITYEVNHRASVRMAELAKRAGIERFVFASSCSLYGAASPEDMLTEEAAFNPLTPYGESKVMVERDVAKLADDSFTPVFLRNATVYGYSPKLRLDLVVNDFVSAARATRKIVIKSDGTPWRPLVHVEDVARAALAAVEAPRQTVHNQAFNIGRTAENYQVSEVAEIVAAAVPDTEIVFAEGGQPDARCYRVDFSKAESSLPGYGPRWTVPAGVRQMYDAFTEHQLRETDLAGSRFIRLRRIRELLNEGRLAPDLRWVAHPVPAGVS